MRARGRQYIASEVAAALGLSVNTVHADRRRGRLRGSPTGLRHWHYEADAVEEYAKRYSPTPRPSTRGPRNRKPTNPDPPTDDTPETKR